MVRQTTVKHEITISGVGLHTGVSVNLTFKPAPENTGYRFRRIDMPGQPIVEADVDNVSDTDRGTTISKNGAKVSTIEHVLAALAGMEIDNVLMDIDGPEVPIMDGSSRPFIEVLEKAGIQEQDEERHYYYLSENITYEDPSRKTEMLAVPSDDFRITVMVDYNSDLLGTQHATLYNIGEFKNEISDCRTFCFLHELEMLLQHNLIKGGDVNNAIVVVDKPVPPEKLDYLAKIFRKDKIIAERGFLNNVKLRFQNEPARHKLLDIVGDLALVGAPLKGHILAARPGHVANVEFARKIKELMKRDKFREKVPSYDPNQKPLMDVNGIMKYLPHRSPFLFVDKIVELSDRHVVGVKSVTMNEWYFPGHFPGAPVMPGVIQIEAMAQVGGILVLNTVPDPENYLTYFMKIDNTKFRDMVVPGDTIIFTLELISPIRRGICHMRGKAFVGDKVVMESEMMAQIVKKDKKK
ncbi:MAG: bifunctional UDP-3-O-[3-hydroxymyristoyl] N-acetylglucosamine deacetylase/3-hydroxyacyl-ACP dehydratase [Bacteroidetes bacterium]|nr:MAG: bifunctional UDP-3-O-[3-hydroxymyristoyl] N-acetylglucosamine deacetylase/3-hydroxyacyl-ACP dehydratase [Bacteroidota bacterium]REK08180.1 MAG: bifunctional UDP-3-O-[3-hydroxymyristoyl] N-acetylglucosamine deacetylase/3-hydroxyacyl-ACP dehydratase [Bacteroidota bacterium]REK32385.1 MAG: bifunctional UDP-3-O-[3-hydroxymyristoyl] N-acetylglucosamine deacetylase/3-hydroxyacyl-ACP dehydratase [Bacteroidota bacterium]REK47437.1 MAG: bifunctional UDP-3-O-[3-hydroxymyristoyl] N-acetylglucosamin